MLRNVNYSRLGEIIVVNYGFLKSFYPRPLDLQMFQMHIQEIKNGLSR